MRDNVNVFFFWNRFLMIFSKKNDDGTQNGTLNSYFDCKVIKSHFWKLENNQNSRARKIWSKYHLRAVDTVLESWNIILFDSKILGTILGTIVYHFKGKKNWILAIFDIFHKNSKCKFYLVGYHGGTQKYSYRKVWTFSFLKLCRQKFLG